MPTPTPAPTPGEGPPVAARPRVDWVGRGVRVLVLAGVGVTAALVLAPSGVDRFPGPEGLGKPAPFALKADRDYDLADPDATAHRRAEAAAAQAPVYDLDGGASDEAAARIHAAFEHMRGIEAEVRERAAPGREAHEVQRAWAERRDAFVSRLQVIPSDDDLAALAATRFSAAVEGALAALAHAGLDGLIVQDPQLLPSERDRGLVVRVFRDGAVQGERTLLDLGGVRSLEEARDEVTRQAAAYLAHEPPRVRAALVRLAVAMVRPTLVNNQAETDRRRAEAAAAVKPVVVAVKRGERIVADGERLERRHLVLIEGMRSGRRGEGLAGVRLGAGALVMVLCVVLWTFARRNLARFRPARRDAVLLGGLLSVTLALGAAGFAAMDALEARFQAFPAPSLHYLVPVAAGAMIAGQVLSAEVAMLFGLAAGLATGLVANASATFTLYATLTSVVAAGAFPGAQDRASPFRAAGTVGLVGAALAFAIAAADGWALPEAAISGLAALAGGVVLLPVAVLAALPFVERAFGYVTDGKLLELASLNHPALKELILQAPGTYHHSIRMGTLVEAAAGVVGANPLLAKVCAYYHDIGKIRNPAYFAENLRGENKHDGLAPSMSALIVKRHVTDGVELARQWKLPRPVADAIATHHGTRLVAYFWAQARAAGEGSRASTDEALFRYPGPKPQTREAALVLLADACEASAREVDRADEVSLRALVRRRIHEAFEEGQLDACDLTLRDLGLLGDALTRGLLSLQPAQAPEPRREPEERRPPVKLVGEP